MQVLVDLVPKEPTRFIDIEVSRLFVLHNIVFMKVSTTQAMRLDHDGDKYPVEMNHEVQRVSRVVVTAHR